MTRTRLAASLATITIAAAVPFAGAAWLMHAERTTSSDGVFSLAVPSGWQDVSSTQGFGDTTVHALTLESPGPNRRTVAVFWTDVAKAMPAQGIIPEFVLGKYPVTIAGEPTVAVVQQAPNGGYRSVSVPTISRTVDGAHRQFGAGCSEPSGTAQDDATCLAVLSSWRWETPSRSHALPVIAGALGAAVVLVAGFVFFAARRSQARRGSASA